MRKTIAQILEEIDPNQQKNIPLVDAVGLQEASMLTGGDREYKQIFETPNENISWGSPSLLFDIFH